MPLIKFNVRGQSLRQYNSVVVAANASNYLQLQFNFLTADWSSVGTKTAYLINEYYSEPFLLNEHNQMFVPARFLKAPGFSVSLFGGGITTNAVSIPVVDTGVNVGATVIGPETHQAIIERLDALDTHVTNLKEMSVLLDLTKADGLRYNDATNELQLMAGENPLQDPIALNGGCDADGIVVVEIGEKEDFDTDGKGDETDNVVDF